MLTEVSRREKRGGIMAQYQWSIAETEEADLVFDLIVRRIRWMDEVGIKQWNVEGYTDIFPREYYKEMAENRLLYVLKEKEKVIGGAVILEDDTRWEDKPPAYYIHNLVGDKNVPGAGNAILKFAEEMAEKAGKKFVRLDCSIDNEVLNRYYEEKGYLLAGTCKEGEYKGYCRQKYIGK